MNTGMGISSKIDGQWFQKQLTDRVSSTVGNHRTRLPRQPSTDAIVSFPYLMELALPAHFSPWALKAFCVAPDRNLGKT